MKVFKVKYLVLLLLIVFNSCSNNDEIVQEEKIVEEEIIQPIPIDNLSQGLGLFRYTYNLINFEKIINVYYYIPQNKTATTPILFIFHGAGRNAEDYRNAMIEKANEFEFVIIAPEFSEQNFPTGDNYNLGNVFIDGDNPSTNTLNSEGKWTFSIIEPLFDFVKTEINNTNESYDIFGHSAGGQFAHRFMMFKPNARINKAVVSASGWYTFPDFNVDFPYGFKESPLENSSLNNLFSKQIFIQIGENDDNPNSAGLRHNEFADLQGMNRKERATNFFQKSEQLAQDNNATFNWSFHIVENANHDYKVASANAADLIFN